MLKREDRLVVAVSGGPDSVALLKVLTFLAAEFELSLVVAHLNHGLRGEEADREEGFVRGLCREMGLACVIGKVDVAALKEPGKSLEELCREKRYAFLKQTTAAAGAVKIALGHHLHDQAETVLMHLLRGSGTGGLGGMLPVREGMIIRPLLEVTREDILAYLEEAGLSFMTDSSNAEDCFLRNRIRKHLLPFLKEGYNPQVEANLAHTADILRLEDDYMGKEVESWLKSRGLFLPGAEEQKLFLPEFLALHEALQRRILKVLLAGMVPPGKAVGYKHVEAAVTLTQGSYGSASVDLPGVVLRREYEWLLFTRRPVGHAAGGEATTLNYCHPVCIPGRVEVREAALTINFLGLDNALPPFDDVPAEEVYMDYEALRPPLVVRNFIPGDRIQPLGMTGLKKLKSIFSDEKVPRARRGLWPLLADQESIIWIVGMRLSERVKVSAKTRLVLKAEIV